MNAFLIALTVVLSGVFSSAMQQGLATNDMYQKLPEAQREALMQALDKLVAAEKAGDWKAVYVLLDKQPAETEEAFVAKMKGQHALREFRASKITFMPPDGSWNIQGCASFAGEHGSKGHVADLTARWKDSQWYLSVISFVPFGTEKGGKLRECSIPQAGPNSASASDISSLALTMGPDTLTTH
jgi:hypothetical protein